MVATIGYWKIRGLAQSIRLYLEYLGVDYIDKLYGGDSGNQWLDEKFNLGLDLPNIPYFIDGDLKISQSNAIMRYLGRKNKMDGKNECEKQRLDMMEYQITDHRFQFAICCYMAKDFEADKKKYADETLPKFLGLYSSYLGTSKWIGGGDISYVDFLLYEGLDVQKLFVPGCLDKYESLQKYHKRFESLDAISKYKKSPKCINWPVNGPVAQWGGK